MRPSDSRWILLPISVLAALLFLLVSPVESTAAGEGVDAWAIPSEATRGEYAYTNRLIDSNDPYLLLHAHNPVDWYPWGPEAFAKAKRENKPIFLSIGYSTCYWCHVAEKTIYSNPDIARLMNEWFVNIKVDREQRPDLDQVYMLATRLLTGQSGWPNNLFLTPELKPFYAGSYFPPEDDSYGRVGFPKILAAIHGAWTSERDRVGALADAVETAMKSVQSRLAEAATAPLEPAAWMAKAKETLLPSFDPQYGGYLSETTPHKFPSEPVLDLLLTDYRLNRDPQALDRLVGTLNAMAYGGIWDHLGKGFYRYSTDRTWSIPHFEKMLTDNAQLLIIYAEAYRETSLPLYRRVAIGVVDYLGEHMMAPQGGFYAAQDSQVKGREGAGYLWTRDEIEKVLGPVDAKRFFQVYALTPLPKPPVDTPAADDAGHRAEGGVLRIRLPIDETLKRTDSRDVVEMLSTLEPLRQKLLAVRDNRPQPARDKKIIVDLNGIAIAGFAICGQILERPEYIGLARRAAERIWNLAYDPKTGRLMHEIFQGHAQTEGYLADYAHLGEGFMALYEVTGETVWRQRAAMLADAILERFARKDGALAITPDDEGLLILPEDAADDIYPSGTSATIELLLRLSATGGDARYKDAASRVIRHSSGRFARHPEAWASAIVALNENALEPRGRQERVADETAAAAEEQRGSGFHVPDSADHVHASAVANTAPDRDEIVVTLGVEEGYHINANPASLDFLIPTSVSFDSLIPAEIRYPEPVRFKPAFAAEALDVYKGSTEIVAIFPKQTLERAETAEVSVTMQACDAEVCLLPATLRLTIEAESGSFDPREGSQ